MPVAIGSGGKRKKITTIRALLLRLREKALNGDLRALEKLLALGMEFAPEEVAEEAAEALTEQERAMIDVFLERHGVAPSSFSSKTPEQEDGQ